METVGDALILLGALWLVLAALGVLKFDEVFARMHAGTKATSLGVGLVLAGAAFHLPLGDAVKLGVTGVLVFLTAPVGAHLIGRAVHHHPGTARVRIDTVDELDDGDP